MCISMYDIIYIDSIVKDRLKKLDGNIVFVKGYI